ncbi:MAG TPA: alpha/beta hydrolase [Agriterribacter sp.]|nr:alpha/beta hydrolase [Agriterribacter sp.]
MSLRLTTCFLLLSIFSQHVFSQKTIALYELDIPGAIPGINAERYDSSNGVVSNVSQPTLSIYLPSKENANGAAVVICPGGGYGVLVMQNEGHVIAQYLASRGVAAFVLKYRLPNDKTMLDKSVGPLQDAQQAIHIVRQHSKEWNVDPGRVGIMGFSAGGHLASTAGTHFDNSAVKNKIEGNVRPDFMILVYPVVSMTDSLGHGGSRDNLLGKNPSAEKIKLFSNELQVTTTTPPTFLIHAGDDKAVDVDNSISFYEALRHHHIPAEMHIYPQGGHGFVLKMPVDDWMNLCVKWMKNSGLMNRE